METKDIKGLSKKIEQLLGVANGKIQQICNDTLKIYKPKDKKKITINGKECEMSLIEDGRVMIVFPDIDSSEEYFKEPPVITNKEHIKFGADCIEEGRRIMNIQWERSYWFDRLFKRTTSERQIDALSNKIKKNDNH